MPTSIVNDMLSFDLDKLMLRLQHCTVMFVCMSIGAGKSLCMFLPPLTVLVYVGTYISMLVESCLDFMLNINTIEIMKLASFGACANCSPSKKDNLVDVEKGNN